MASRATLTHSTTHLAQQYKAAYDRLLGNRATSAKVANFVSNCILLVIFAVGCVGAAQGMPASAMGWTVVGLGLGYLAVKLCVGDLKKRKIDVLVSSLLSACIILIGALGVSAALSQASVGYTLFGLLGLSAISFLGLMIYAKRYPPQQAAN